MSSYRYGPVCVLWTDVFCYGSDVLFQREKVQLQQPSSAPARIHIDFFISQNPVFWKHCYYPPWGTTAPMKAFNAPSAASQPPITKNGEVISLYAAGVIVQSRGCHAHENSLNRRNVQLQLHVCMLNKDVIRTGISPLCMLALLDHVDNVSRSQNPNSETLVFDLISAVCFLGGCFSLGGGI